MFVREIPHMRNERVCHMAKIKGVQVSATISNELNNALEDHRWTVRKTKAEVVKAAIEEYAEKHNLEVATPLAELPAGGTSTHHEDGDFLPEQDQNVV